MAVDTAAKRLSMLAFEGCSLMPLPDSTISAPDREVHLGLYAGIALSVRGTTPSADPDPGLLYWGGTKYPNRTPYYRRVTA